MIFNSMLLVKIGLGFFVFIITVRFLFSASKEEEEYSRSKNQIRQDINKLKSQIQTMKGKIPPKELGEMMDDLLEEYYKTKE